MQHQNEYFEELVHIYNQLIMPSIHNNTTTLMYFIGERYLFFHVIMSSLFCLYFSRSFIKLFKHILSRFDKIRYRLSSTTIWLFLCLELLSGNIDSNVKISSEQWNRGFYDYGSKSALIFLLVYVQIQHSSPFYFTLFGYNFKTW